MAKLVTQREVRNRRMKYQAFAGMLDFIAIVAGILVIIACTMLLHSLWDWMLADQDHTFTMLFQILNDALIQPK